LSDPISILVAQLPEAPTNPTTNFVGDEVVISWTAGYNGGTAILAYNVQI